MMMLKDTIIEKIKSLPVKNEQINHWEKTKYKPYMKKYVELDKVLEIIDQIDEIYFKTKK